MRNDSFSCIFRPRKSEGRSRFSPIWLAVFLLAGAPGTAAAQDRRLAEANALLGDAERYHEAVALYRAILADDPGDDEARHWLARVLSWQGDEEAALVEYELLACRETPREGVRIERAEVLSWAGRNDEARAAFEGLLAADPGDARAARGLARALRWSGRTAEAERAYLRALRLEEDPEARRELAELRDLLAWVLSSGVDYAADSDGFVQVAARARAARDLDHRTRWLVSTGWTRIDRERRPSDPPGRDTDDHAFEGTVGVERRLGERVRARLAVGGRRWQRARNHVLGRAGADARLPGGGVLAAELSHGDFLARSASFDAVRAGLRDTTLRISHWQPFRSRVEGFVRAEGTFLDDGNRRVASGLSLELAPWEGRDASLVLAFGQESHTRRSDLYYDPELDVAGSLAFRARQPLAAGLGFELRGEGGAGYASQDGAAGFGPTWGVSGGPSLTVGEGWWLRLRGRVRRSQRITAYTSHGADLGLGREF